MTAKRKIWFLICLTQALAACSYNISKQLGNQEIVPSVAQNQLSFAVVNRYVFQPSCSICHGTSGGISLETYSSVRKDLARIENAALNLGSMPKNPVPALSESQKLLLKSWIESGAPETAAGPEISSSPTHEEAPLEPKFVSIKKNIFDKKCILCHCPNGKASQWPLTTANDLLQARDDLVVPGDPDQSYLLALLTPGARRFMPQVGSGISPVSEADRKMIQLWIQNGAKD